MLGCTLAAASWTGQAPHRLACKVQFAKGARTLIHCSAHACNMSTHTGGGGGLRHALSARRRKSNAAAQQAWPQSAGALSGVPLRLALPGPVLTSFRGLDCTWSAAADLGICCGVCGLRSTRLSVGKHTFYESLLRFGPAETVVTRYTGLDCTCSALDSLLRDARPARQCNALSLGLWAKTDLSRLSTQTCKLHRSTSVTLAARLLAVPLAT